MNKIRMGKALLLWNLCWLMLMIGVVTCWNSMIPFQGRHYLTSDCKFAKGCTSSMSIGSRSGVVCYGRAMYRQVGGSNNKTSLSQNEIENLLKERSDARKVSNYDKADEILSQLKQKGVAVQDTFKIYRTDGLTNFDKETTTSSTNNIDNDDSNDSPTNNQDSYNNNNNNKKKKKSTMMKQKKGKSTTTTTVVVYEYTKAVWSQPISTEEDVHIQKRLKVRSMAKMNRDFDVADDIRDELRYQNNVIIDDDSKSYRKVDSTTAAALSSSSSSSYTFGGKRLSNVSPEELQQIETLLSKRIQAKKKRDFVTADSILSQLEVQHAVRVYDKKKQWHFDKHRVLPTNTSTNNSNSNDYDGNGSFKGKTKQEKMTVQEAQSLSVKELRTLLRDNNLTIGGTKDKLIQRLLQKRIITKKKKKTNQPFFVENTTSTSQSSELDPNQSTGILTSDDDDIYGDGMFFASSSIPDGISIIDDDMPDGISIIEPTTTSTTTDKITKEEEEEEKEEDGSLNDLTVVELKEKLRAVGLPVSGNKMVLMERLQSMTTTMKEPKELSLLNHDTGTTASSSSLLSRQELNEMTVVQLKEKLRDANLSVVGKKADLVDRLMKAT